LPSSKPSRSSSSRYGLRDPARGTAPPRSHRRLRHTNNHTIKIKFADELRKERKIENFDKKNIEDYYICRMWILRLGENIWR
jgi:hypothetical protein